MPPRRDNTPEYGTASLAFGAIGFAVIAFIFVKVIFFPANAEQKAREKAESRESVAAIIACKRYIKSRARHSSTVEFSTFGTSTNKTGQNTWLISMEFTAKNSFGVELKHQAYCEIDSGTVIDSVITEV